MVQLISSQRNTASPRRQERTMETEKKMMAFTVRIASDQLRMSLTKYCKFSEALYIQSTKS